MERSQPTPLNVELARRARRALLCGLCGLGVLCGPAVAAAAPPVAAMYGDTMAREKAIRVALADPDAPLKLDEVRAVVRAYEAIVAQYPASAYSDNGDRPEVLLNDGAGHLKLTSTNAFGFFLLHNMVAAAFRGRGLASVLCGHSLEAARRLGFRAVQFNFVVATNAAAVRVWERHGFAVVGRQPRAFRHATLGLVALRIFLLFRPQPFAASA